MPKSALILCLFLSLASAKEIILFNHLNMNNWKVTPFPAGGAAKVQNSHLRIEKGNDCSGVRWSGDTLPLNHYELTLEAKRISGTDFFCGLTFPIDQNYLTLIVGGWGGNVVGLSCIDWLDASENETGSFHQFSNNRWYQIKLSVQNQHICVWINEHKVIDCDVTDKSLSLRYEVKKTKPLGITTWQTTAEFRNIILKQSIDSF